MLFESNVRKVLRDELKAYPGSQLTVLKIDPEEGKAIVRAQVNSPLDFSAADVVKFEAKLPAAPDGMPIELRLRNVKVKVITRNGDKYEIRVNEESALLGSRP